MIKAYKDFQNWKQTQGKSRTLREEAESWKNYYKSLDREKKK